MVIPAPAATSSSAGNDTYTVRSGDFLFGIAQQQGVAVGDLLGADGLTLTSVIHPRAAVGDPGSGGELLGRQRHVHGAVR